MKMAKPLVIGIWSHKGGVSKTTATECVVEALDETSEPTLTIALDDQEEIAGMLVGKGELGDKTEWTWGNCGEVMLADSSDLPDIDMSGASYVFIDAPPMSPRKWPKIHIDRVILMYREVASIENNEKLIRICEAKDIPWIACVNSPHPEVLKWGRAVGAIFMPWDAALMRLPHDLSRPIWDIAPGEFADSVRRWVDGCVAWIKEPVRRTQSSAGAGVRTVRSRRAAQPERKHQAG